MRVYVLRASYAATTRRKQRKHRAARLPTPSSTLAQYVLTVYDKSRHVNGSERNPGRTRVTRPGFDPVVCPCERGVLLALSSLAQPLKRVRSIPEHFFVILSQCKSCAGRFREETAGKRTGPITRWPLRRLLFTRLEIIFVTISPFTKRTKVAHKVFEEG